MDRARRAGSAALFVVVLVVSIVGGGNGRARAATVAWPVSTLVVSELETGGASASDEFVEIANQGSAAVDLFGLEVVYATSTGSTVTRKGTWTVATLLAPGQRLLLANSAGVHASIADATYSGGFAATGGAIALRVVGGVVIDGVGWGDATNSFVEGSVAPAPPAGSSLERHPGGAAGNGSDTNDDLADWFVQGAPSPQNLAAPFVPAAPGPSATPAPTSTPAPTPTPSPSSTPEPTAGPTATPAVTPTASVTPAPSETTAPTPIPTPTPTPSPMATPTPSPVPIPIQVARDLPDGSIVLIEGILTTDLGALESGHGGFVQDATGGIAVYLDAPVLGSWPAGMRIRVSGEVGSRFAQRTLRAAEASIAGVGVADLPPATGIDTGAAGEPDEGRRVEVTGAVTGAPDQLTDGLGITIDDGSGPVRAVVGPLAVAGRSIATGMTATVIGPLGQRDSSGTGTSGYRVNATLPDELQLVAPTPTATPSPTPTPNVTPSPASTPTRSPGVSPTPGPSGTPAPTPTSTPSPSSTPTPAPTASAQTISTVRLLPIGTRVTTVGIVVAEAGRIGSPSLVAIHDGTGGLVVHGADDGPALPRGTRIEVTGKLAAPYGQLEIKPTDADVHRLGTAPPPPPLSLGPGPLGETDEGQLVTATGRLETKPAKSSSGDVSLTLVRDGGTTLRVMADSTSRLTVATFRVGTTYRITGVVGQRASRTGALDGYRIWLRDAADLSVVVPAVVPSPSGSSGATSSASSLPTLTIAAALRVRDRDVRIEGIVTIPPALLDGTGRRIVVQDASAAVELLVPGGTAAPPVGTRLRAVGRIGLAYGAPRLKADSVELVGTAAAPQPVTLHVVPGLAHEWRLVTISGRVSSVHKLGDRWRAEIAVGGKEAVVVGQPGSGIASTALVEGRQATVTGIVRRPYPNATDRRFAVTPRFPADVRSIGGSPARPGEGGGPGGSPSDPGSAPVASPVPVTDVDVIDLAAHLGRSVRIGGLVVELRPDGFTLDDGTAVGRVELRASALDSLALVEPDDALNVIGRVETSADGPIVVVDDAGRLILAGDPGADTGSSADPASTSSGPPSADLLATTSTGPGGRLAALGGGPLGIDGGAAGIGTLVAITGLSIAITMLRRRYLRRRLTARIADRLATLTGLPGVATAGPTTASVPAGSPERDVSTIRSA